MSLAIPVNFFPFFCQKKLVDSMGKTLINMFVLVSDIPAVNSDISKTIYPLLGNGFLEQSHSIYLRYSR